MKRSVFRSTFVCVSAVSLAAYAQQTAPVVPPPPAAAPPPPAAAPPPPAVAPAPAAPVPGTPPPAAVAPAVPVQPAVAPTATDAPAQTGVTTVPRAAEPPGEEPSVAPAPPSSVVVEPAPAIAAPAALFPPLLETSPAEAPEPEIPDRIQVGKKQGYLQVGAYLQAWALYDYQKGLGSDVSGQAVDSKFGFRLRRAQIKLKGQLVPEKVEYGVVLDALKTLRFAEGDTVTVGEDSVTEYEPKGVSGERADVGMLQEFWVTFKLCLADVSIGQWKSPIAREGSQPNASLLLPERAASTRYFGDEYMLGVRLAKEFEVTDTQALKYSLQLLNGRGLANRVDNNRQKDLALRLEYSPIEELMVGGAGMISVGQRDQETTRDAVEGDVKLETSGLLVDGQLVFSRGRDGSEVNRWRESLGGFVGVSYTIAKTLQPVVRVGFVDVDERVDRADMPLDKLLGFPDDQVRTYELGANYLVSGNDVKLSLAYGYFDFDDPNLSSRHQAIFQTQLSF